MSFTRLICISVLLSNTLFGEVKDKWKINLGALFVTDMETQMQITPDGAPAGIKLNSKDQLGLEHDSEVLYCGGYYRFNDKHGIRGAFFSIDSDGSNTNREDFIWGGKEIEKGSTVESFINVDIYEASYVYSFYHNEDVELALSAGLHIAKVDMGLHASGVIDGVPESETKSSSSFTAPLPTFGFKVEYAVLKNSLYVKYTADYFYLEYEDIDGSLTSTMLSLEYRLHEHIGMGLGFMATDISLERDDGAKRVEIDNEFSGIAAYLVYVY